MNRYRLSMLLLLICALAAAAEPAPTSTPALRSFGYFIGDVLTQRIPLHADGKNLELVEPPADGRVGRWLQRLRSRLERDDAGLDWLLLTYQITNSPRESITIMLPSLNLPLVAGEPLVVAPLSISVSPLTPTARSAAGNLPSMRPDRQPDRPVTAIAAQRLRLIGLTLGLTVAAWLGWWLWRGYADGERLPFAAAWHRLRGLQAQQPDDNPDAWLALHRAFNSTAGRNINSANLDTLLQRAPWLAPQRARIEDFYALSTARFFAQTPQLPNFALIDFGRELYRAEKRNAGGREPRHGAPR